MDKKDKNRPQEHYSFRTKGKGIIEDATEYGEFISSFDSWLPIEEQKKNAEKMEHLGD